MEGKKLWIGKGRTKTPLTKHKIKKKQKIRSLEENKYPKTISREGNIG